MADRQGHLKVCWWSMTSDSSRWGFVGLCFVFSTRFLTKQHGIARERADKYNSSLAVGVAHDWMDSGVPERVSSLLFRLPWEEQLDDGYSVFRLASLHFCFSFFYPVRERDPGLINNP